MADISDVYIKQMDREFDGMRGRVDVVTSLLREFDPEVLNHLETLQVNPQFFLIRWITTLLTRSFS